MPHTEVIPTTWKSLCCADDAKEQENGVANGVGGGGATTPRTPTPRVVVEEDSDSGEDGSKEKPATYDPGLVLGGIRDRAKASRKAKKKQEKRAERSAARGRGVSPASGTTDDQVTPPSSKEKPKQRPVRFKAICRLLMWMIKAKHTFAMKQWLREKRMAELAQNDVYTVFVFHGFHSFVFTATV